MGIFSSALGLMLFYMCLTRLGTLTTNAQGYLRIPIGVGLSVLLLGETGTGKELLAHAIHMASARADGPFVSLNIAAVPDTLLEAEFFGFAPGAFTGADRRGREGKFKLADGGTLFLDEIGDMPMGLRPSCCARSRKARSSRWVPTSSCLSMRG